MSQNELPPAPSRDAAILQYVVDNLPYLIFWKDKSSVYLGCNKNFAALDGKTDPRALVGRTDFDMAWKEHAHLYRAGDLATMQGGVPILDKEEVSIDERGRETVILTSKVPLRDAAGEVTGTLGIIVDITARKQLELELKRAKELADHAARAKTDFLANITHELRTPLTLILGPLSRVLSDPGLEPGSRRLLESVRRNGFRLYDLVNDVLDFSKAESTRLVAYREPVEVVGQLGTLIDDMRLQAELRQLRLGFASSVERLDAQLDVKLLERMVINLVGNAIKFTREGGRVDVSLGLEGGQIRIAVSDDGIGIPRAKLDTLFEKFTQVDDSTTRRHDGTGLGLALVRHFALCLGGRVEVQSEEGRGSEFTLHLPFVAAAEPNAPARAPEPMQSLLGSPSFRQQVIAGAAPSAAGPRVLAPHDELRPWVLVAEDNAELREFTLETLASDFAVVGVANGAEAWLELSKRRFDVVVSDLMMPELDGLALTAKIKAHPALRVIPVILVTARGGTGSVTVGLDAGADDYLSKPFAPEELLARVRAAQRVVRLQHELRARARETGAAVAASAILHDVGNVLNGVSVSAELLERPGSALTGLEKLGDIWAERCTDPAATVEFLTRDERGQRFGVALARVITDLRQERAHVLEQARDISHAVAHASAAIGRQLTPRPREKYSEPTDVAQLVERAIKLSASGRNDGVDVHTELRALPLLFTDGHALLLVFVNLLTNARQAIARSAAHAGQIHVRAACDAGEIVVVVRDTGVGIPAADLLRLFQQGFSTRPDGHGLGLHGSLLAVQGMGGTLTAESPGSGEGATFTVRLPVAPRAEVPAAAE